VRGLILTHRRSDPSFRVRWGRFLPVLAEAGFELDVREVGKSGRGALFQEARDYDIVILHRRLMNVRDFVRLRRRARRIVFDFDDALYYRPGDPHRSWTRERRFFRAVSESDLVLAGNRNLAGIARLRARRVFVLPSTVDVPPLPDVKKLFEPTAVWIGQRATLPLLDMVQGAVAEAGLRLRVIADAAPPGAEFVPWTLEGEQRAMAECHMGIMPLPATPYTRGKCGYKLLQYYAAGLPAITSPVGVNRVLAEGGALLARDHPEWVRALRRLAGDAELRARLAQRGRSFVAKRYAAGPLGERLARLLSQM